VAPAGQWSAEVQSFWDERLDEDLNVELVPGAQNEVLVRVHNRSMNSQMVTVNAYWAEAGLFLDPGIWHLIGPEARVTVPAYGHAVVRIPWRELPKPTSEATCLIATVESECDPLGIDGGFWHQEGFA
jgi:hypothetical protein